MKNIRLFSLLFFSAIFVLSLDSCKKGGDEELDPYNKVRSADGFKQLIDGHGGSGVAQILDIRQPDYFAIGHIPGAKNIYATAKNTASNDGAFAKEVLATFDKSKPILIYGAKSSIDLEYVVPGRVSKIGFGRDNTFVLLGGFEAWEAAYPGEIESE